MATAVDRPRSAFSESPVTLQPHRRPSIIEVIDVDELEEPSTNSPSRSTSYTQGNNSQSDTVLILDDSDEEEVLVTRDNIRPANRQRLISPPPPRAGPSRIPPVPVVPRRFSGFTAFTPPHRRPHAVPSPPIVRPIAEPLAFEANLIRSSATPTPTTLHSHPNRHRRISYAASQAESRSHHVPSLGLGGALISLNRGDRHDRQQRHEEAPGLLARAGNTVRRVYAAFSGGALIGEDNHPEVQAVLARSLGLGRAEGVDHPIWQEILHRRAERQEEMYKTEYTHPGLPEPGYTHDFAMPEPPSPKPGPIVIDLDSDDGTNVAGPSSIPETHSSSSAIHTILVCARCTDPLVLGGRLVGENQAAKKIWALRCGHMIDGKCLDIIGVPAQEAGSQLSKEEQADGSYCTNSKGKGKAIACCVEIPPLPPLSPPTPLSNSMRSRLRSRVPPPPMPVPPSVSAFGSALTSPDASKSTLGKRKRSSHAKLHIEATYEWKCPVGGCGRVHVSVKINGVWMPEPVKPPGNGKGKGKSAARDPSTTASGRGVVAVFV